MCLWTLLTKCFLYVPDITCLKKLFVMCDETFEVVVHHGGIFKQFGPINYIGGETTVWDCDPDTWSYYLVQNNDFV